MGMTRKSAVPRTGSLRRVASALQIDPVELDLFSCRSEQG